MNVAVPIPFPSLLNHQRRSGGLGGGHSGRKTLKVKDPPWASWLWPDFRGLVIAPPGAGQTKSVPAAGWEGHTIPLAPRSWSLNSVQRQRPSQGPVSLRGWVFLRLWLTWAVWALHTAAWPLLAAGGVLKNRCLQVLYATWPELRGPSLCGCWREWRIPAGGQSSRGASSGQNMELSPIPTSSSPGAAMEFKIFCSSFIEVSYNLPLKV